MCWPLRRAGKREAQTTRVNGSCLPCRSHGRKGSEGKRTRDSLRHEWRPGYFRAPQRWRRGGRSRPAKLSLLACLSPYYGAPGDLTLYNDAAGTFFETTHVRANAHTRNIFFYLFALAAAKSAIKKIPASHMRGSFVDCRFCHATDLKVTASTMLRDPAPHFCAGWAGPLPRSRPCPPFRLSLSPSLGFTHRRNERNRGVACKPAAGPGACVTPPGAIQVCGTIHQIAGAWVRAALLPGQSSKRDHSVRKL